jgi:hypothetical protein
VAGFSDGFFRCEFRKMVGQSVARDDELSAALCASVDRSQVVELKAGVDDRGMMRI